MNSDRTFPAVQGSEESSSGVKQVEIRVAGPPEAKQLFRQTHDAACFLWNRLHVEVESHDPGGLLFSCKEREAGICPSYASSDTWTDCFC